MSNEKLHINCQSVTIEFETAHFKSWNDIMKRTFLRTSVFPWLFQQPWLSLLSPAHALYLHKREVVGKCLSIALKAIYMVSLLYQTFEK